MTPLHHHFELIGWPETKIVARFRLLGVACAALTLLWLLQ
jgi:phospho-N-acetylmuramoyl-pentapeptide-transferase